MLIPSYGEPVIGILYDAVAGNDSCNGKIAPISNNDRMPDLKECLFLEDVRSAIGRDAITQPGAYTRPTA